jgi:DNA-binding winged helix-turn-helix (wHTH) protein
MKEQETKLAAAERITLFGRFALQRAARALTLDGQPVSLNDRAMDVLIALVDARGRIVPIGDLQQGSSPTASVVANNSVQAIVSQLRRALGEDRDLIETVPRRGYRLATEWYEIRDELASADDVAEQTAPHVAQAASFEIDVQTDDDASVPLIGRNAEVSELMMRIGQHRLVTLMGPPGIGKTRLAQEAAPRTAPLFEARVHWIDLGGPSVHGRLADDIAAQLATPPRHAGIEGLVAELADKPALLVIDHGERHAPELAPLVDALLARTQASVVVCAQAPLFVSGEWLMPLAPLRYAAHHTVEGSVSDACRLLVALLGDAASAQPEAQARVASIGHAVSGNPRAMQLAAQQIRAALERMPLDEALARWNDGFRAAQMRHGGAHGSTAHPADAVRAAVALAFHALDRDAQVMLCRASLYAQPFSHADAHAIAALEGDAGASALKASIDAGLVLERNTPDKTPPLSVPAAVREFTLARLAHRTDYDDASARHAHWLIDRLPQAGGTRAMLADVRRALGWALDARRIDLAARLLQTSGGVWSDARRIGEHLHWITLTLDHADARATLTVREHMLLALAFAQGQQRMRPEPSPGDAVSAWWRVYDLATVCADDDTRLAALSVLLLRTLQSGYGDDRPDLLAPVRERIALECDGSSTHPGFTLLRGVLMTLDGRHEDAIALLAPRAEDARTRDEDGPLPPRYIAAVSHNALAISLWLTGARTPSHPALVQALTDARQLTEPVSRCTAAALACVLFLLEENNARIAQQARLVCAIAQEHGLAAWETVGRSFVLWTEAADGSLGAARQLTDRALVNLERRHATLNDLLVLERYVDVALHEVGAAALLRLYDGMLIGIGSTGRRWLMPEALRVSAVLRRRTGADEAEVASLLERAAEEARKQKAARLARRIAAMSERGDGRSS